MVIQRYEIEYLLVMIALRIRFVCTYFLDVRKWELLLYHWSELSCTESFIDMISKIRFFKSLSRGLYYQLSVFALGPNGVSFSVALCVAEYDWRVVIKGGSGARDDCLLLKTFLMPILKES